MKVVVIGTGYVGLVSGVCLSSRGHEVTCVDLRTEIINQLNNGQPHIYEEGLEQILHQAIESGNFKATRDLSASLDDSNLVVIAVGTPSENGEIDLTQIYEVSKQLGEYIGKTDRYISVVVKSTVIPGTTDLLVKETIQKFSGKNSTQFGLGMNPEFLREGNAVDDFISPDRIVIGFEDEITRQRLCELYSPWQCDKIFVNTRTAEMIKYANNTILATIISLNNELANLAGILGDIDYNNVIKGVLADKRWSPILKDGTRIKPSIGSYFIPGIGFGGSCFLKDVEAIRTQGKKMGLPMSLTGATLHLNANQVGYSLSILESRIGSFYGKKVLILGLAFKPDTDDVRESSAVRLAIQLLDKGVKVKAHDPIAIENAKAVIPYDDVEYVKSWEEEISGADIIVIGANWKEYEKLIDYDKSGILKNKIVFDSKRMFTISELTECFYFTVGYSKN